MNIKRALFLLCAWLVLACPVLAEESYSATVFMGCNTQANANFKASTIAGVCSQAASAADAAGCLSAGDARHPIRYTVGAVREASLSCYITGSSDIAANVGDFTFTVSKDPETNACANLTPRSFNVTAGYASVSGWTDDQRPIMKSFQWNDGQHSVCSQGCGYTGSSGGLPSYVDLAPLASGLSRLSVYATLTPTGSACTPLPPDKDPLNSTYAPPCTGTTGTVNGKTVCIAGKPTDSSPQTANKQVSGPVANDPTTSELKKNPDGSDMKTGPNGELPGKIGDVPGQPTGTSGGTGSTPSTSTSTTATGTTTVSGTGTLSITHGTVSGTGTSTVPTLYTKTYQDGLTGVWAAKKSAMMATPINGIVSSLQPAIPNASGYPQFPIHIIMLGYDLGTYDPSPPPAVWDFCKLVILISALFLCRALIFGG